MKHIIIASGQKTLYHGTTSLNRSSIEKRGLIVNGERPSVHKRASLGMKPFGGIYLGCFERAKEYAVSQSKYYGGKPLIVEVLFTPDDFTAFDDDLIITIMRFIINEVKIRNKSLVEAVTSVMNSLYFLHPRLIIVILPMDILNIKFYEKIKNNNLSYNDYKILSIIFGKLIPYIPRNSSLTYDPYRRLRYLKTIGFTGMNKISKIYEL